MCPRPARGVLLGMSGRKTDSSQKRKIRFKEGAARTLPRKGSQVKRSKALQRENCLPSQVPTAQSTGTKSCPSQLTTGKARLTGGGGPVQGPVDQMTPPRPSPRHLPARVQYKGLV